MSQYSLLADVYGVTRREVEYTHTIDAKEATKMEPIKEKALHKEIPPPPPLTQPAVRALPSPSPPRREDRAAQKASSLPSKSTHIWSIVFDPFSFEFTDTPLPSPSAPSAPSFPLCATLGADPVSPLSASKGNRSPNRVNKGTTATAATTLDLAATHPPSSLPPLSREAEERHLILAPHPTRRFQQYMIPNEKNRHLQPCVRSVESDSEDDSLDESIEHESVLQEMGLASLVSSTDSSTEPAPRRLPPAERRARREARRRILTKETSDYTFNEDMKEYTNEEEGKGNKEEKKEEEPENTERRRHTLPFIIQPASPPKVLRRRGTTGTPHDGTAASSAPFSVKDENKKEKEREKREYTPQRKRKSH